MTDQSVTAQNPPSPEREWQQSEENTATHHDTSSVVPETTDSTLSTDSMIPLHTTESDLLRPPTQFPSAPDPRQRRQKIIYNVFRVIFIVAMTLALLLLWQGVAHSQDNSEKIENDPSWLFNDPVKSKDSTAKPVVSDKSTANPAAPATSPSSKSPPQQPPEAAPTSAPGNGDELYKKAPKSGDARADMRTLIMSLQRDPTLAATSAASAPPATGVAATPQPLTPATPNTNQPGNEAGNEEPGLPPAPSIPQSTPSSAMTPVPPRAAGSDSTRATTLDDPRVMHGDFHDRSVQQPLPLRGSPMMGDQVQPLNRIADEDLLYTSTLELALAFDQEFADRDPPVNPRMLRGALYQHLVELSVKIGFSDNPRDNLDAVRAFLFDDLHMTPVVRDKAELSLLLPREVLATRRGSPKTLALLALLLADRVNDYLRLEPVLVDEVLGLRYRSGHHRYTLVPRYPDRLYSDRELVERVRGTSEGTTTEATLDEVHAPDDIRVLTRKQFWGLLCADAGEALLEEKHVAWGATLIDRALRLYGDNPRAHIARAHVMLEQNDSKSAEEELNTAVQLAPESLDARLRRIDLLEARGMDVEVERDLLFVAQRSQDPTTTMRLIELYLRQKKFAMAERVSTSLRQRQLPKSVAALFEDLDRRVGAAPWIAQLDPSYPPQDRFEAVTELSAYPLPGVKSALVEILDDDNLRLAHLAWKTLGEMTHFDLPRDPQLWSRALEQAESWEHTARR